MAIPDLSNSMFVARLRHIQSVHEPPERRNPDVLVRRFLPLLLRWRATWIGRDELAALRADPFYYYLLARTRYYDRVFNDAVSRGVRRIVGIGCGSDTRAFRFSDLLRRNDVKVLECDLGDAIEAKRRIARRWPGAERVEYLAIDLNNEAWPELERRLTARTGEQVLIMMEGVSPYIDDDYFRRFLKMIATSLPRGSEFAYDFKLTGVKMEFGRTGRTRAPFRLPPDRDEVAAMHRSHGLDLTDFQLSSSLTTHLLPDVAALGPAFDEDGLLRLRIGNA
jgi:methyltransferase (TIGR00027 family)